MVFPKTLIAIAFVGVSMMLGSPAEAATVQERLRLAAYVNNNTPPRPTIKTAQEARDLVNNVHFKVFEVVKSVCKEEEIPAKRCTWNARVEKRPGFQAFAYRGNEIVIHSGLIDKIASEDELAFVIAHEIAHHMLRHVAQKRNGVFIGTILGAVTGLGAESGLAIAVLASQATSSSLERQADAVAAEVIRRSGYDPRLARNVLLRMAKMDGRSRTRFLESHPAGLDRLLEFDKRLINRRNG